jgi:hypothetical protein
VNLPTLDERMRRLLELTAVETRKCKACGVMLFFVQHSSGKVAPYTADGLNHFVNCPQAERFKKGANRVATA